MKKNENANDHLVVRRGMDAASIKKDYEDHLRFSLTKDEYNTQPYDRYTALSYAIRDRLTDRWLTTRQTHFRKKVKRVNYLSLEFLMGRVLSNNIMNLCIEDEVRQAMDELGVSLDDLKDMESDMGLGNGGLGRLAACFLDSLATLDIPAFGYGIRYHFGIFRQSIVDGQQEEKPDEWLRWGCPWEIPRPFLTYEVHFGGHTESSMVDGVKRTRWVDTHVVIGTPFDVPIVGYGADTVNTLRLWDAHATDNFDFEDFNKGDYVESVIDKVNAENITKALYPNDHHYAGQELRLKQQYLFVTCSLQDIIGRFKSNSDGWDEFPDRVAVQLNDTHPSLAVPEMMRLLVDVEGLAWDYAWDITVRSLAYTNHTLMPEALEKWSMEMMGRLLPRHLEIIYEINHKFIGTILNRFPNDMHRVARMSIIEEGVTKRVRMAHLAIVGSHSVNGVAEIHTQLLKDRVVPDFAEFYPERFNAKTNGITQRRWLLGANPPLAKLVTDQVGDGWIKDLSLLRGLTPLAEDAGFRSQIRAVKLQAKEKLSNYMARTWDWKVDPNAIFDVHIKRLHEYKRQLMNAIHIAMLYNKIRQNPGLDVHPRVFLFGGKAAPGYYMAKLIIKLINDIAAKVNNDPLVADKLKVFFLPNYRVTLAELMIPAADLSEQISTAGTEASGTGNMKFMLNGALTIGTMDGANIEMAEEVGKENMFIFGLDAEEAAAISRTYDPWSFYEGNAELKAALDLIFTGHFNEKEPHIYEPIRNALLEHRDPYLVLADIGGYATAHERALKEYGDQEAWSRKAVLNVAASGKFSSDRTIREYADQIWNTPSCVVPR